MTTRMLALVLVLAALLASLAQRLLTDCGCRRIKLTHCRHHHSPRSRA